MNKNVVSIMPLMRPGGVSYTLIPMRYSHLITSAETMQTLYKYLAAWWFMNLHFVWNRLFTLKFSSILLGPDSVGQSNEVHRASSHDWSSPSTLRLALWYFSILLGLIWKKKTNKQTKHKTKSLGATYLACETNCLKVRRRVTLPPNLILVILTEFCGG